MKNLKVLLLITLFIFLCPISILAKQVPLKKHIILKSAPNSKEKINIDEIKKAITVHLSDEKVYLYFPEISKIHHYQIVVTDAATNKAVRSITVNYGEVGLPSFDSKTTLNIAASIIHKDTGKVVQDFSVKREVNDTTKPTLEYAYIDSGYIYVQYQDNYKLASTPLGYKLNEEGHFSYTDGTRFRVSIPSKINIVIEDFFGNTTSQSFDIKQDNVPLTANVPSNILNRLQKNRVSDVETFRGVRNVVVAEYGKELDFIDAFETLFEDFFSRYREKDLTIKANGLGIDSNNIVKLNKEGVFLFNVSHRRYKDEVLNVYVIVKTSKKVDTNIYSMTIHSPYIINKNKIKLIDYINFESVYKRENMNISFIFAKLREDNLVFSIKDTVILSPGKHTEFEIIDLLTGDQYPFDIQYSQLTSSKVKNFNDVTNKHWAYNSIVQLTNQGILAGYPDGSFKPNLNITVREFTTMLSRFLSQMPENKVKPFENETSFDLSKNSWGYLEVKSVLDRIPKNKLYNFSTNNLDRYITREEVAFLIANTIQLKEATYAPLYFSDVATSRFYYEIQLLFNNNMLSGYPDHTFRPSNNISRAEVCAILTK